MEKKMAAEAKAKAKKELADERARWEQQFKQEHARRERSRERTMQALMDKNEELTRRLERMSANERGEAHEVDVFGQLQAAFSGDRIDKRGRGGDIIHAVRYEVGGALRDAGTIVYECKDTLRWSNSFISQIKKAGQLHKTAYLVLVTHALPSKEKHFCVKGDVIVVQPSKAVHLAKVVRRMVIETHRAGRRAEGQSAKTSRVLEYLNSDDFKETFGAVVSATETLRELLREEQTAHERVWRRREHAYNDLARKTAAVDEEIQSILEADGEGRAAKVLYFPQQRKR